MKFSFAARLPVSVVVAFCALAAASDAGLAQTVEKQLSRLKPFAADQVRTIRNKTTNSKVYFNQNAMRGEGFDAKGNQSIQIMRFDQKVMWNLVPAQKMYLEMPWASMGEFAAWADQQGMQRESLGAEQVGQYQCEKFRVHVTLDGKQYTSLEWDAQELGGLPVKTEDQKRLPVHRIQERAAGSAGSVAL
jgi:hypothetical protein